MKETAWKKKHYPSWFWEPDRASHKTFVNCCSQQGVFQLSPTWHERQIVWMPYLEMTSWRLPITHQVFCRLNREAISQSSEWTRKVSMTFSEFILSVRYWPRYVPFRSSLAFSVMYLESCTLKVSIACSGKIPVLLFLVHLGKHLKAWLCFLSWLKRLW